MPQKFLVSFCNQSTPSQGNVALIDVERQTTTTVPLNMYGVTGIKISSDKKYLFAIYQSSPTIINIVSLEDLRLVRQQVLSEVHDAHGAYLDHNLLYVTSTGTDCIELYQFDPKTVSFSFVKTFWKPEENSHSNNHHLNSIYKKGVDFFITMYYSEKPATANDRKGYVYNISQNKRVENIPDIYHPHSLVVVDHDFWYCESVTQTVKKGSETVLQFSNNGYIRGLAVSDDLIALGVSSFRSVSRSSQKINNYADAGVPMKICKVKIFDRKTLAQLAVFNFYPEHTEVFGIVAV